MATDLLRSSCVRTDDEIALIANQMRHDIITMLEAAGTGHPGGSLSATDIMATLYFSGVMGWDADDPKNPARDRFVLSKGHVAPALYAVLSQMGYLAADELTTLRQPGSRLQGHPDSNLCPGVEVGTGSLGQGLSIAAGMALGLTATAAAQGTEPRRVFCLTGDGELQEGSNWEAAMFAAHRKLGNLVALIDHNNLQIDGHVSDVCDVDSLKGKFEAFGWHVIECAGHDIPQIRAALEEAVMDTAAPVAIVFGTVKGKGVSFMEDQASWHGNAPSHEQAAIALAEIEAARAALTNEKKEA